MIMPAGREKLLLPVNPRFIALSLLLALFANMLLNLLHWSWLPDLLGLVLLFWTVHQNRRTGMTIAFVFGLLMDVHQSALLGQNALAYVGLTYLGLLMQRRLLWFPMQEQALQVLPLFMFSAVVQVVTRLFVGDGWPSWGFWLGPLLQALLWPVIGAMLLAPQRRPYAPDKIRPL
jgi:rod shape-determining protein MreD